MAFDIYEREVLEKQKWFPYFAGKLFTHFLNRRTTTMLYLGIDQHARQITISLRDDSGDVLQARQVSTRPEKIQAFFGKLTGERLRDGESRRVKKLS
jgi:hypothetical protein